MQTQVFHVLTVISILCVFFFINTQNTNGQSTANEDFRVAKPFIQKSTESNISQLIQEAIHSNPEILSSKSKWSQTIEKYPQVTALDDPMLNFSYYIESVETRVGPQEYMFGVSQRFPFPGTLRQQGRVIEKEIEIARLDYEKTVRDIIVDLKQAVYELQYLDGSIGITKQNKDILSEILSYAEAKYSDQSTGLNDVFRAESQLAQLDYDLITLRELRSVQQSVINSILNRPTDEVLPFIAASIPNQTTFEIQTLDQLAHNQNQEIQLARFGVDRAEESIKLARKQNLPTFNIGANYIDTGEALNPLTPESGKDPIIIGGGISIPIWLGKNKARIRYAKEGKETASQKNESVVNTIEVNLRKTFFRMQNADRLVTLYRDHLIPQAEHSMQIAEEWSRNQQGSISEVLEVQSVWLNFNLAWLRARVDYAQSYVQLERIVGGSLSSVLNKD